MLFQRDDPSLVEAELVKLAQAAGYEQDQSVLDQIKLAVLWNNVERIQFFFDFFRKILLLNEAARELLLFPEPDYGEVDFGDIFLGTTMKGREVRLPLPEVLLNLLIMAPPKKGKTVIVTNILRQLIPLGIKAHVFDTQDEYFDVLLPMFGPDELEYWNVRDYRLSPFDGPSNMSQYEWVMGPMCNYLRESLHWFDRTTELFREVCIGLFDAGQVITPPSFIEAYSRIPDYKQRLPEFGSLQRFCTMLTSIETFHCLHGETIEDAAKKSRIYNIRYLPKDARLFFVSHLVTMHAMSRKYQRNRPLDLALVFDELNQFFTRETLRRYQDIGESFYLELLRTGRKIGIASILADQTYSLLHDVARSNCQSKLAMDIIDGPSRREIARDLGLDREQEDLLPQLSYQQEYRRAVVQLSHYPRPFLLRIPNFEKPTALTADELEARRQKAISEMKWEPIPKSAAKPVVPTNEHFIGYRESRIMSVIACHPFLSQKEYASQLKDSSGKRCMPEATFSRAARKLKELKMIEDVQITLHNQGAPINVLIPTETGYGYLDRAKISYRPIPGNGSIPHRFWQHRIWKKEWRKGDIGGIEYEISGTGKRVDIGIIRNGNSTAYEVAMGPNLQKEVENARGDIAAGWGRIIFAIESEATRSRLKSMLASQISESDKIIEIHLLKEWAS
jgi:hypothetical protein